MATETQVEFKVPKKGQSYPAQISGIFHRSVQTKQYGMKDIMDVKIDLLNTDRGDGQPMSVNYTVWKSPNIYWKDHTTGNITGKGMADFFSTFFPKPTQPVKLNEVDMEALKGCYAEVFIKKIESFTRKDGTEGKKAIVGDIMEPEDAEQLAFNKDRASLFYKS